MIQIGIRLLLGRFVATHPANRERAEWPPHPDRVFMALVAAWGGSEHCSREAEALRWLESLGAPDLVAGLEPDGDRPWATCREGVTSYVPVNDIELQPGYSERAFPVPQMSRGLELLPEKRSRQARHFPCITPKSDCVWLRWPAADAGGHLGALARLCRKVTYLGHSSSLVQCWVSTDPSTLQPATLIPVVNGVGISRLRVPAAGRFDELVARFVAGARPLAAKWVAYAPPCGVVPTRVRTKTCFDPRLFILQQTAGLRYGLCSTLLLTRALRATVMSRFTRVHQLPAPEWISGHSSGGDRSEANHLAFLPLADVGCENADGRLLGLALAVPRDTPDEEVDRSFRGVLFSSDDVAEPIQLRLTLGAAGALSLQLHDGLARSPVLRPELWTADIDPVPAHRWATVTPIVLDRHPKSSNPCAEIEAAIRAAASRIGIGGVLDTVTLSPVSPFRGAPPNRGFPNLQRKSGGNLHHTHAVLAFREPVVGPLLLGAGRYRGYGLCRPLPDPEVIA